MASLPCLCRPRRPPAIAEALGRNRSFLADVYRQRGHCFRRFYTGCGQTVLYVAVCISHCRVPGHCFLQQCPAFYPWFRVTTSLPAPDYCARYGLTQRESEVLDCILSGQSISEISEALFISQRTVKFHITNLLRKTGATSQKELLLLLYEKQGKL